MDVQVNLSSANQIFPTVASVETYSSITVHGGVASLPVTFTVGWNVQQLQQVKLCVNQKMLI